MFRRIPVKPCTNALKSIAVKTYQQIKTAHIKEYQKYFNTYSIMLSVLQNQSLKPLLWKGLGEVYLPMNGLEKFASSNDPSFVALIRSMEDIY